MMKDHAVAGVAERSGSGPGEIMKRSPSELAFEEFFSSEIEPTPTPTTTPNPNPNPTVDDHNINNNINNNIANIHQHQHLHHHFFQDGHDQHLSFAFKNHRVINFLFFFLIILIIINSIDFHYLCDVCMCK